MARKNLNNALEFNRITQSLVDLNDTRQVTENDVFLVLDLEEIQALAQPKQISLSGISNSLQQLPGFVAFVSGIAQDTAVAESTNYFLNAFDTTTQVNPSASSGNAFTYNTTVDSRGISVVSGSMIQVAYSGVYNIQFTAQLEKQSANKDDVDIWLSKNGVGVPWSATTIAVDGSSDRSVAAWNFFVSMDANEHAELYWHSDDLDVVILAASGHTVPAHPDIPSIILTVNNVSNGS
jgi:hypothetical protein